VSAPRVLIIGNFLSGHGLSRGVFEELALRLQGSGWRVLTTSSRLPRAPRLLDMLCAIWRHRNAYDVAQVDVFSGAAFRWAEAACRLLALIGRPYILTLHGGALPEFAANNGQRVSRLLTSAVAVTVPSHYLKERMRAYRQDLILLPNAIEVSDYSRRRQSSVQPRLVWLRAFHEIYAPAVAVKVVALLKDEFPALRMKMVGADKGDHSRRATLELARALGVREHIDVCDPIPKTCVPEMLASGDIFLNTSRVDNTPVSVLEAMASGMCVVSTNAGGLPFLLRAGEDSLLVPTDRPDLMAAAVRTLLSDQSFALQLREAGRAAAQAYDWVAILPKWQDLLASAARLPVSSATTQVAKSAAVS